MSSTVKIYSSSKISEEKFCKNSKKQKDYTIMNSTNSDIVNKNDFLLNDALVATSATAPSNLTSSSSFQFATTNATPTLPSSKITKTTSAQKTSLRTTNLLRNSYRISTRAKFCISVLILLCAIAVRSSHANPVSPTKSNRLILHTTQHRRHYHQDLLQNLRSTLTPTPSRLPNRHHHMQARSPAAAAAAIKNMQDESSRNSINERCPLLSKAALAILADAKIQAGITFNEINNEVENYLKVRYNKHNVTEFYKEYERYHLQLDHPLKNHLKQFQGKPPGNLTSDMIPISEMTLTPETLQQEILNIFKSLKVVHDIFNKIMHFRENNTAAIVHEYHRTGETEEQLNKRKETVKNFFEKIKNLSWDVFHSRSLLSALELNEPKIEVPELSKEEFSTAETLIFRDVLIVVEYLDKTYSYILNHCGGGGDEN